MKTRPRIVLALSPLILATLLVSSTAALPVLSVNPQSNADYQLTALVQTTQSCAATPENFSGIACQNSPPGPIFIQALDDGHCATLTDTACSFSPNSATVSIGQLVVWQNNGKLNHTVTSDSGSQYSVDLFLRTAGNSSFFPFPFSSSISYVFASPGTFSYHDKFYPGLTGTITVNSIPAPAPIVRDFTATGPVNWTAVGLDQENALLSISHHIDVYNVTSGTHTLLASHSGVFEDSIKLSTRLESADLSRILNSLPYVYGYGYGFGSGYGGGYWLYPPLVSGPGTSYPYPIPYYSPPEIYTVWWVNGPLFMGSTVEVLTSTGSVRGSETVNLGISLGSKEAWIVGSQFKDQYTQPPPPVPLNQNYPQYFSANNSIATSLQLDYGKTSDLMLATSDKVDQSFRFGTIYPTGSNLGGGGYYFGPVAYYGGGGITLNQPVTVIRTQETSLSLTLNLGSTNIDLNRDASPPSNANTNPTNTNPSPSTGTNTNPTNNLQGSLTPMLYTVAGIIVTTMIGSAIWLLRRTRIKNQSLLRTMSASTDSGPQAPT